MNNPLSLIETRSARGKEPRWYEDGSHFHDNLSAALRDRGITFLTSMFLWDGANSVLVRNDAAIALAHDLAVISREKPSDPIVIVAHSHGGNLALRALHVAGPNIAKNVKLITLATPFLQIFTSTSFSEGRILSDPPVDGHVLKLLSVSLFLFILIVTILLALAIVVLAGTLFSIKGGFGGGALVLACLAPLFAARQLSELCLKMIVNPFVTYPDKQGRPDDDLNDWGYKPDRLASATYCGPVDGQRKLLVLRGVDDEASLSLAAGALGNRITHYLLGTVLPNGMQVFFTFGAVLVALHWMTDVSRAVIWAGLLIVTAVMLMLPGMFRRVFGREMLFGAWRCEVSSNSAPDVIRGMEVVTLQNPSQAFSLNGLRHSLHGHPEAIPKIVEWLARDYEEKPKGSP